jgi:hypothetical protein
MKQNAFTRKVNLLFPKNPYYNHATLRTGDKDLERGIHAASM